MPFEPLTLRCRIIWAACAIFSFHLAYEFSVCAPLCVVFLLGALQLSRAASARGALYAGWAVGMCIYGPQLAFFWSIFNSAAIVLWLILSSWLALYLLLQRFAFLRLGRVWGTLAAPLLWTGLEYFRSELYYLRFSWLIIGYVSPSLSHWTGMYGAGFILMIVSALFALGWTMRTWRPAAVLGGVVVLLALLLPQFPSWLPAQTPQLAVAGVQLEEPSETGVLRALDDLDKRFPNIPLFVLSEYTFFTAPPEAINTWCAQHKRWLIVGGKEFVDSGHSAYRNTAFVFDPSGSEVFQQAKSRPIQFFDDGLPAARQAVWDSPWGKIGLCICYDLSYTRVTDGLIRQGAQAIIVPTMDVQEWGAHEHALHSRVAPTRAAEYGVPIFRLCSSGISQAVSREGRVLASAPFPGQGQTLSAMLPLPSRRHLPVDRRLVWPCMAFIVFLVGWQIVVCLRPVASTTQHD